MVAKVAEHAAEVNSPLEVMTIINKDISNVVEAVHIVAESSVLSSGSIRGTARQNRGDYSG